MFASLWTVNGEDVNLKWWDEGALIELYLLKTEETELEAYVISLLLAKQFTVIPNEVQMSFLWFDICYVWFPLLDRRVPSRHSERSISDTTALSQEKNWKEACFFLFSISIICSWCIVPIFKNSQAYAKQFEVVYHVLILFPKSFY